MKKLIFLSLIFTLLISPAFSQVNLDKEDYMKYIDTKLEMEFRSQAIKAIDLTEEEIIAFDPIFRSYMSKKENLLEKKMDLINDYYDEMYEDDSVDNQNEDRADFVEDYLEVEIQESKLRKNHFDVFEDKIPVKKAIKFFVYEDAVQNRVRQNELTRILPSISNLDKLVDKAMVSKGASKKAAVRASYGNALKDMDNVTMEDYQRYIDKRLEIDFRNESTKVLQLTREEIIAFDPVFKTYMAKRENILEKKVDLLEELRDELAEDDSRKNEEEDVADFIEDYWELEIDEMQLRKNSFDILEDKINENKAIKFFLWEEAIQDRVKNYVYTSMVPAVIKVKTIPSRKAPGSISVEKEMETKTVAVDKKMKTLSESTVKHINDFDQWVSNNQGMVDVSHEYSSNGIKALMNTIESTKNDLGVPMKDFDKKKEMILSLANDLTIDYRETDHADKAKKAFTEISSMMATLNQNKNTNLYSIAQRIDPNILMTKQANHIYSFFKEANMQLKTMMYVKVEDGMNSSSK